MRSSRRLRPARATATETIVESAGPGESRRCSRFDSSAPSGRTPNAPPLPSGTCGLRGCAGASSTSHTPGAFAIITPSSRLRTVSTGVRNGSRRSGSSVARRARNCGDAPPQPAAMRAFSAAALARRSTSPWSAFETSTVAYSPYSTVVSRRKRAMWLVWKIPRPARNRTGSPTPRTASATRRFRTDGMAGLRSGASRRFMSPGRLPRDAPPCGAGVSGRRGDDPALRHHPVELVHDREIVRGDHAHDAGRGAVDLPVRAHEQRARRAARGAEVALGLARDDLVHHVPALERGVLDLGDVACDGRVVDDHEAVTHGDDLGGAAGGGHALEAGHGGVAGDAVVADALGGFLLALGLAGLRAVHRRRRREHDARDRHDAEPPPVAHDA